MKIINTNAKYLVRLSWARICLRLFFGILFLFYSFSPMIFDWNQYESCKILGILDRYYILIVTSIIAILIALTFIFYLFIYIFLAKEKKRKIQDNVQPSNQLKKRILRLNLLKKQTIFLILFSLVF